MLKWWKIVIYYNYKIIAGQKISLMTIVFERNNTKLSIYSRKVRLYTINILQNYIMTPIMALCSIKIY